MEKVKKGLLLIALCATSALAQGVSVTPPKVTVTAPKVAAPAAPQVAAPEAPAAPTAPAAPSVPQIAAPAAPAAPVAPVPAVPAAPELAVPAVADSAAAALDSAKAAVPEPVVEPPPPPPPPKVEPAPAPVVVPPPAPAKEPLNIKYHLGARLGVGISALRGHVALGVESGNQIVPVQLKSAFSYGLGVAFGIEINDLFTVAPELQYTLYRANGATRLENEGVPYQDEAGIRMHSFELPIFARFNFSSLYAEVGPQLGYNSEATSYKNDDSRKLYINGFAFGPSIGFGTNMNGILLGIRGHLGVLEYAKNTKGYPWAVQVSVTNFFF